MKLLLEMLIEKIPLLFVWSMLFNVYPSLDAIKIL
jgi:hypothetical protein